MEGHDGILRLHDKFRDDHGKPEARARLKAVWEEYMKTYRRPAVKKRGRHATLDGHGAIHLLLDGFRAGAAGPAGKGGPHRVADRVMD